MSKPISRIAVMAFVASGLPSCGHSPARSHAVARCHGVFGVCQEIVRPPLLRNETGGATLNAMAGTDLLFQSESFVENQAATCARLPQGRRR